MISQALPALKIGKLTARVPIIQGGMGVGISLNGLASAVANEGGIGVISATGIGFIHQHLAASIRAANPLALRLEIQTARAKTKGLLGVNILTALTDYGELAKVAFEEGIDLIFLGAGLPLHKPEDIEADMWRELLAKVVPIVSSGRAASLICRHWQKHYQRVPDAFVLEGPLAGGHLGFNKKNLDLPEYQLEKLLPELIAALKPFEEAAGKPIAVIPAGGIYTGADIYKYLSMGAQGVQMASRFVATHECDASEEFKQAYLSCKPDDLLIIDSPVGLPGRAINNKFLKDVAAGLQAPVKCFWHCLLTCDVNKAPYCIAVALMAARSGRLEEGFAFAGANVSRIQSMMSVKELMDSLIAEYQIAAA
jgi:nitronate monooxygenase